MNLSWTIRRISAGAAVEWQTTSTLLSRLRDNDESAWSGFVERFRRPVIDFCRGYGLPHHDAEDVAQDTLAAFAEAYRRGKYDRDRGRLSRWLFGIAYHQILRQRQRCARRSVKEAGQIGDTKFWAELPDEKASIESWDQQWEQSLLAECLKQASLEFQPTSVQAFQLSVIEDRPAAEVAEQLNVSVKTIYNAKHRMLKRIRELREQFEELE